MSEQERHESYGIISIGRCHGAGQFLFGSSIEHHNTIRIAIDEGYVHRDLNHDWYMSNGRPIIEIILSPTQFAEAITSLSNTPCTISYRRDKGKIEQPPFESKLKQFNDEFEQSMKKMASACDEVIVEAKNRKYPQTFIKQLELLKQQWSNNIPFVNESFTRQMENTVKEAKGEVEAFITNKIHTLGIDSLRSELPDIAESKLLKGRNTKGY